MSLIIDGGDGEREVGGRGGKLVVAFQFFILQWFFKKSKVHFPTAQVAGPQDYPSIVIYSYGEYAGIKSHRLPSRAGDFHQLS